jgi:shikimate dehydrogenase
VISAKTMLYGILGDPVEHSLSPVMQNAAFQDTGIDAVYLAFCVNKAALQGAMAGIRGLGIGGVNVTIPHKMAVMKYLDEVDSQAKLVGAVNTVRYEEGRLVGFNTDGLGAIEALKEAGKGLNQEQVVLIGAGGAARAISHSLVLEGSNLTILNRNIERAQSLVDDLGEKLGSNVKCLNLTHENLEETLGEADFLINATSVGMAPEIDETPVEKKLINSHLTVFDIVYNPLETRLLREAKENGAKVVDGLGMLVHQGAAAFELWTGHEPPVEVMRKAALERLKEGRNDENRGRNSPRGHNHR